MRERERETGDGDRARKRERERERETSFREMSDGDRAREREREKRVTGRERARDPRCLSTRHHPIPRYPTGNLPESL